MKQKSVSALRTAAEAAPERRRFCTCGYWQAVLQRHLSAEPEGGAGAAEGAMREHGFSNRVFWYNFILCFLVVWVHAVNAADTNAALALSAGQPGPWDA